MMTTKVLISSSSLLLPAFFVVALGALVAASGHNCAHSTIEEQSSKVYFIPQPNKADHLHPAAPSTSRKFQGQAVSPFPVGWHGLRLSLNYTFAEDPSLDAASDGTARTCSSVGQDLAIGGQVANSATRCLNAEGKAQYTNYCWLECRAEDVVNKTALAKPGSILQKLKAAVDNVITKYGNLLATPDITPDNITIEADKTVKNCGDLIVPKTEVLQRDMVLMVTLRPLHMLGSTLAFARTCALDSNTNRPILGHMNVAPATLHNNQDLETVLLHEIAHALGFSPSLFKFFRHPNDRTKSYYQHSASSFPTGPIAGDGIIDSGNGDFSVDFKLLGAGKKLSMVSPNVLAHAKTFFNCPTLTGVELENGGASQSSTASHWEKRILYYEYMTATQNLQRGAVSLFTLNFFKDTGFYEVNAAGADDMRWGKAEGCSWATGDCKNWASNYFCTTFKQDSVNKGGQCGYDRRWNGACALGEYTADLPVPYQHFNAAPTKGGLDAYADHCPLVQQFADSGDGRGNCLNPNNYPITNNYWGVKSGQSSRCFSSSVIDQTHMDAPFSAGCFEIVCTGTTPRVLIGNAYYPCNSNDERIQLIQQVRPVEGGDGATPVSTPAPTTSPTDTVYVSWAKKGTFECGSLSDFCTSGTSLYTSTTWSEVSAIAPSEDTVEGGALVTITGVNLHQCYGLTIGGQWVTNITKESSAKWTANVPAAGTTGDFGGPGLEGVGIALVELWCNVTQSCPSGCAVSRLNKQFNYTTAVVVPFNAMDWFMGFIDTPIGKAVGGGIGVILLILLVILVKSCCEGGGDADTKKGKGKGKGKGKPGQREGVLQAPSPHSHQPAYAARPAHPRARMQEYEEDLL